jgi:hypothetical protein
LYVLLALLSAATGLAEASAQPDTWRSVRRDELCTSADERALASGLLRRQIGLKLRAQDTCNVVYAMWHIEPDSRIAVSVKRNPGKHRHVECGVQGYVTIEPSTAAAAPTVSPGSSHTLRASLDEDTIEVDADGVRVFSAKIDQANLDFDGPVGLRTDNGRFTFALLVPDRDRTLRAVTKTGTSAVTSSYLLPENL